MGIGHPMSRPAVFLDRDGVVNQNVVNPATGEWEAPLSQKDFCLAPGAAVAMKRLHESGFLLILVSNQPNYAKGKSSLAEMAAIHDRLLAELQAAGARLDEAYYCYHHPSGRIPELAGPCDCRKPSPYFLQLARDAHAIDLRRSWMIGDRDSDIACGQAAGVRTIFVNAPGCRAPRPDQPQPHYWASSLAHASEVIRRAPPAPL